MTTLPLNLYTSAEVAEMLGLSEAALRIMRVRGEGPAYIKLSTGRVRYRLEDVEAWIAAAPVKGAK